MLSAPALASSTSETALVERFKDIARVRSIRRSGGPERGAEERRADAENPTRLVAGGSAHDRSFIEQPVVIDMVYVSQPDG
jgi:hypothetical protein